MKPEKIETDQQGVANPFLSPQSIGVPHRESAVTRRRFFLRLAMIGALMGASIPIGVIGSCMAWEVLTGATYQGQLYHEDGPEAFFYPLWRSHACFRFRFCCCRRHDWFDRGKAGRWPTAVK